MAPNESIRYRFLGFELDPLDRILTHAGREVPVSARVLALLLLLVQHPGRVFSRDELVDRVWPGRYVTQNSLDQALSRLRRTLSTFTDAACVETVYGKGIRFTAEVVVAEATGVDPIAPRAGQRARTGPHRLVLPGLAAVLIALAAWTVFHSPFGDRAHAESRSPVWLRPSSVDVEGQVGRGVHELLGRVLNLIDEIPLRPIDPASGLAAEDRLAELWRMSPALRVVTTRLEEERGELILDLEIRRLGRDPQRRRLRSEDRAEVVRSAAAWLSAELGSALDPARLDRLVPGGDFLVESYLRGLASLAAGNIDAAADYFEICLQQRADHALARLELAHARYRQGRTDEALAMVQTLAATEEEPGIRIAAAALHGDILDTLGQWHEARGLFERVLADHAGRNHPQLRDIRYNLGHLLAGLGEFDAALGEFERLEAGARESHDPEFLAHVYQKHGSVLLETGEVNAATEKTRLALVLFERLGDPLGRAKTASLMARIYTRGARYEQAARYLDEALSAAEAANYPLGIGATLNEAIAIDLRRGLYRQAAERNERMRQIAVEIAYAAMLQAARQHDVELARAAGRWDRAEAVLDEHLATARAGGNRHAVARNHLMRMQVDLDRGEVERAQSLLDDVQAYIDDTGELRMQPELDYRRARLHVLRGDALRALELIETSRRLAVDLGDFETVGRLDGLRAAQLLDLGRPEEALALLSAGDRPMPWEHLRLCARAHVALGQRTQALDCLNGLRRQAMEAWTEQDERLLAELGGTS